MCTKLGVYTSVCRHPGHNKASFLEVLLDLPKITTLRVAAAKHPICLPSVHLQHVTCLELGVNVSFRVPPQRLRSLVLEDLQLDHESYDAMFSGLQSSHNPVCIQVVAGT